MMQGLSAAHMPMPDSREATRLKQDDGREQVRTTSLDGLSTSIRLPKRVRRRLWLPANDDVGAQDHLTGRVKAPEAHAASIPGHKHCAAHADGCQTELVET